MYNYVDLFSGIGGFPLGAYMAGVRFKKHYFSEIEDYASRLYQKRFPKAKALGNVINIDWKEVKKEATGQFIVTGGFP